MVFSKPNLVKARLHLKETAVVEEDDAGGLQYQRLLISPSAIGSLCGLGMELYFSFLKYAGSAFTVWAICQIPMLVCCALGSGTDLAGILAQTTASNIGEKPIIVDGVEVARDPDDIWDIPGFGKVPLGEIFTALGILDAAGFLFFMLILGWFIYRIVPRKMRQFDERNTTPSDFAVEVNGLPQRLQEGHEMYEEKLRAHFAEVLKQKRQSSGLPEENSDDFVTEISLVRDYKGCLLHFQGLKNLQEHLDNANEKKDGPKKEKEIAKLTEKLTKLREKTKMPIMKAEERSVKRAFVMLNKCENKELLEDAYRFGQFHLTRMCQGKKLQFAGHKLRVTEAPEPLNLMWENQDRNEVVTFLRRCFSILLTLVCFAISFVLIFASKIYTAEMQKSKGECVAPDPNLTKEEIRDAMVAKQPQDGKLSACDCHAIGEALVNSTDILRDKYCKEWLLDKYMVFVFLIVGALVIVIINQILRVAVVGLTKMERPLSVSQYYVSMAIKLFIAQWFNTALILIIVNSPVVDFVFPSDSNSLDDLNRIWYERVGLAIVTTMIAQTVSPHMIQVIMFPMLNCVRRCKAMTAETQRDLNALYTYPDFQLAVRLAQLFNVMFCTLIFIAGCPVLAITASLTFFTVFLCDKFILLRASKRPPQYDGDIILMVRKVLPVGCFIHATFAVYMLGNQKVFPSHHLIPSLSYDNISGESGVSLGNSVFRIFFERGLTGGGFAPFLLWLLLIVYFALQIAKFVLGSAFGTIFQVLATACGCAGKNEDFKREDLQQNKRNSCNLKKQSIGKVDVFSYLVEYNPAYNGLVKQANSGDAWAEKDKDVKELPPQNKDDTSISAANVNLKKENDSDDEQQADPEA